MMAQFFAFSLLCQAFPPWIMASGAAKNNQNFYQNFFGSIIRNARRNSKVNFNRPERRAAEKRGAALRCRAVAITKHGVIAVP
jgi:hypothetical protein